jgi:hypothetical protein
MNKYKLKLTDKEGQTEIVVISAFSPSWAKNHCLKLPNIVSAEVICKVFD